MVLIILFCLVLISPMSAIGEIINVPGDRETIQEGIDAADHGDTVQVHPGIYQEHIDFDSKAITVGSLMLTTGDSNYCDSTVISGTRGAGSVVVIDNIEGVAGTLVGLTLMDGTSRNGGGIFISESNAIVDYCKIYDNIGIESGGGIYVEAGGLEISNSEVSYNETENEYGGGIYCNESGINMDHCILQQNVASSFGGGIYSSYSDLILTQTTFHMNSTQSGGGGGIYCFVTAVGLDRCVFYENATDAEDGGAVYFRASVPFIINCTFSLNTAQGNGDGIFCWNGTDLIIWNSIMWDNIPHEIYFDQNDAPSLLTILYSNIDGGEEGIITNENVEFDWLDGNLDIDPMFVNPDNDFRLSWENYPENDTTKSPCIDTGNPDSEPDPDHTRVDMGALYFHQRPDIEIEPEELSWEDVRVGFSEWKAVTISNVAGDLLHLSNQYITPDRSPFEIGRGRGEVDIVQGRPHQLWIAFSPVVWNVYDAVLHIESNDQDEPLIDIPLRGTVMGVVSDEDKIPSEFAITSVYPNPFNSTSVVSFSVPNPDNVSLALYDIKGREIDVLHTGFYAPGYYNIEIDADNLASGVYMVRLSCSNGDNKRKLILVR